jgi:hypothetical protein
LTTLTRSSSAVAVSLRGGGVSSPSVRWRKLGDGRGRFCCAAPVPSDTLPSHDDRRGRFHRLASTYFPASYERRPLAASPGVPKKPVYARDHSCPLLGGIAGRPHRRALGHAQKPSSSSRTGKQELPRARVFSRDRRNPRPGDAPITATETRVSARAGARAVCRDVFGSLPTSPPGQRSSRHALPPRLACGFQGWSLPSVPERSACAPPRFAQCGPRAQSPSVPKDWMQTGPPSQAEKA